MNATITMIPLARLTLLLVLAGIFLLVFLTVKNRPNEPSHRGNARKFAHGLLTFLQAFFTTVFLGGLAAGLGFLILQSPLKDALKARHNPNLPQSIHPAIPGPQIPGPMHMPGPQLQGILQQLESVEHQLDAQLQTIQGDPRWVSEDLRGSIGDLKARLEADRLRIQAMIKEQTRSAQELILKHEIDAAQTRIQEQAKLLEELEMEVEKSRRVAEHMDRRVRGGFNLPTGPMTDELDSNILQPAQAPAAEPVEETPATPEETDPESNTPESAPPNEGGTQYEPSTPSDEAQTPTSAESTHEPNAPSQP
ncbi:MAG: hypothetical protein PHF14_06800 [Verrucomicrobiota bacterium]|nr:hypothetical protein [Verrucomicrobiota bacterium]MDD8050354.1 hypothetical protein [Verrucomicrobiota bacterium]